MRTQARRLREPLRTYYDSEGRDQPVRIVLERGSYVPIFQRVDDARGEAADVSVAVLPFLNLTGNPDEEYFADGLTEEIINVLARMRGLKIVARTSAFAFKARDVDVREIGARLKVASILEGSVPAVGGSPAGDGPARERRHRFSSLVRKLRSSHCRRPLRAGRDRRRDRGDADRH